jgi:hypothetical protein
VNGIWQRFISALLLFQARVAMAERTSITEVMDYLERNGPSKEIAEQVESILEQLKRLDGVFARADKIDASVERVHGKVDDLHVTVREMGDVGVEARDELRAVRLRVDTFSERAIQELGALSSHAQRQDERITEVVSLVQSEGGMSWVDRSHFEVDLGTLHDLSRRYKRFGGRPAEVEIWDMLADVTRSLLETEDLFGPTPWGRNWFAEINKFPMPPERWNRMWKRKPDSQSFSGVRWVLDLQVRSKFSCPLTYSSERSYTTPNSAGRWRTIFFVCCFYTITLQVNCGSGINAWTATPQLI